MKTKTFDCVAMKRRGAAQIYEQTRGMTLREQLAFWRKRSATLKQRQRRQKQ